MAFFPPSPTNVEIDISSQISHERYNITNINENNKKTATNTKFEFKAMYEANIEDETEEVDETESGLKTDVKETCNKGIDEIMEVKCENDKKNYCQNQRNQYLNNNSSISEVNNQTFRSSRSPANDANQITEYNKTSDRNLDVSFLACLFFF